MSKGIRVLVADDEYPIRGVLAQVIEEAGHSVTTAACGEEACELFRREPFPLVITDIRMPGMSGLQLLKEVKRIDPGTHVMIITSYASLETAIVAIRSGAYDYILKPFEELEIVTAAVARATESIRLAEENRIFMETLRRQNEELESLNKVLKELAIRDGLTGLFNHRYFQEAAQNELTRAKRQKGNLSLLFLDVDNFKKLNDAHGHGEGDGVLKAIAGVMKNRLRISDIASRYGGEEFVVILPETGKAGALTIAEELRRLVEGYPFRGKESQILGTVTVSIGVASFPEDGGDVAGLVHAADQALFRAKKGGRNIVC